MSRLSTSQFQNNIYFYIFLQLNWHDFLKFHYHNKIVKPGNFQMRNRAWFQKERRKSNTQSSSDYIKIPIIKKTNLIIQNTCCKFHCKSLLQKRIQESKILNLKISNPKLNYRGGGDDDGFKWWHRRFHAAVEAMVSSGDRSCSAPFCCYRFKSVADHSNRRQ